MVRGAVPVAVIVAMLAAPSAHAGTYRVNACAGGADHLAWVPFSSTDAAFDITPGCPFTAITAAAASARAGFFEAAWWRFTAPPGDGRRPPADRPLRLPLPRCRRQPAGRRQPGRLDLGGLHRGRADRLRVRARGLHDPRQRLPVRLGFEGPGRGRGIRPRRHADHLPGGLHPRQRLPQRQRRRVPAGRRDDPQRGRDDPRRHGAEAERDGTAARGRLAQTIRPDRRDRLRRDRDQLRDGVPGRRAGDPVRLRPAGAVREREPRPHRDRARRRAAGDRGDGQGRRGQPRDLDAQRHRRRHAAVRAAAAAVGADAGRGRRRRRLGRRGRAASPSGATPLPTTLARGRLTARLPSGNPRRAEVRVTVTDNAGNSASGVPPRIDVADAGRARATGAPSRSVGGCSRPAGAPLAGVALQATATIRRRGATAAAGGRRDDRARAGASRSASRPGRAGRAAVVPAAGERPARRPRRVRARPGLLDDPRLAPRRRGGHARDVLGPDPPRRAAAPAARARGRAAGPHRRRLADVRGHADTARGPLEGELPVPRQARAATRSGCGSAAPTRFPFELGYSPTTTVRVR